MTPLRIRFVAVVWGEEYTRDFLDTCLNSLLTVGNFESLRDRKDCLFRVYTTQASVDIFQRSSVFARLKALMPVELAVITGLWRVGKYASMTQAHAHFVREQRGDDAVLFFMSPDVVWADGAIKRAVQIADAGTRMILMATPRLRKESLLPALDALYRKGDRFTPIPPRALVTLALSHLHPETSAQMWNGDRTAAVDGVYYWKVGGEGLLLRQAHLFPFMVRATRDLVPPAISLDADFAANVAAAGGRVYVVGNSDEICCMDFTRGFERPSSALADAPAVERAVAWLRAHTTERHRAFLKYRLRFYTLPRSAAWDAAEAHSDDVLDGLLAHLPQGRPDVPLAAPSPWRYVSPTFYTRKVRDLGVGGLLALSANLLARRIAQRLAGPTIRVRVAAVAEHPAPPTDTAPDKWSNQSQLSRP